MKGKTEYKRIVILGDPHLPGRLVQQKKEVVKTINGWNDVDLVVCIGDVCSTFGTKEEYQFVKEFFKLLEKPIYALLGNHDNYYSDKGFIEADSIERNEKFKRFRSAFSDQELYFSIDFGAFRLFFLALDGVESSFYSAISKQQIAWFEKELKKHSDKPAMIFCHAPLWSEEVLRFYPPAINYIVQPAGVFNRIVKDNKSIRVWVSGHVHFGMVKELVMHPFNHYENRVINVINTDMDGFSVLGSNIKPEYHDRIWTRSLYFFDEKVVCKTFDHNTNQELKDLETTVWTKG